jgi:hypothetical protein
VVNEVNNKVAGSSVSESDDSTRVSKFEIQFRTTSKDALPSVGMCSARNIHQSFSRERCSAQNADTC